MTHCQHEFTPALIKAQLKKAGITQKQIAREEGRSEMSVSDVINFKMVSKPLMRAIARRLGVNHRVVFAWYFGQQKRTRPDRTAH